MLIPHSNEARNIPSGRIIEERVSVLCFYTANRGQSREAEQALAQKIFETAP